MAAAAGGAAANYAINRAANYLYPQPPQPQPVSAFNMQPVAAALPAYPPRRGRNRRGRGQNRGRGRRPQAARSGQPSSGISTASGSTIIVQDTEVLGALSGTLQVFEFNPSVDAAVRLASHEKMYSRYRILYFNIAYKSGSATNVAGNYAFGIAPGPKIAVVNDQDAVMKLRPSVYGPVWKNSNITVGRIIDSQKFMYCGKNNEDGISFTLYAFGDKGKGMLQISYKVEFAYPHPF